MLNVPRSTWALAAKLAVVAMLTVFVCVSPATASDSVITLDGTPIVVATTDPGETALVTFDGVAGQRVSLRAYASTMHLPTLTIQKPSGGTMFTPKTVNGLGLFVDPVTLPETGTYTIVADPPTSYVGSLTLAAWVVPPDTTDTVAIGGSTSVSIAAPGQNASLTFAGTAGGRVSMTVTNVTAANTVVQLKKPDCTNLGSAVTVRTTGAYIDPVTLPVTGTYTITIDPREQLVGTVTFRLDPVPDNPGTAAIGSPTTVTIGTIGENATRTFAGTAGQMLTLGVTGNTIAGVDITIRDSSNAFVAAQFASSATAFHDTFTLPATGTYTMTIDPRDQLVGAITITLNPVPENTGATAIGTPTPITIGTIGENALRTFTAAAGQSVTLSVSGNTIAQVDLTVRNPSNGTVSALFASGATATSPPFTLPVAGTYTITVDPRGQFVGSLTFTLTGN
jgi:hypothetical protein